jgi:Big-like domain-containing protein
MSSLSYAVTEGGRLAKLGSRMSLGQSSRFLGVVSLLVIAACGGGTAEPSSPAPPPPPPPPPPPSPTAVVSVTISPPTVTIDVGATASITATVLNASGQTIPNKTVQWLTSDASIVGGTTTGNSATLQGMSAGAATVTATVDGITGNLPVVVRVTAPKPVASVTITPPSATIVVGGILPMVATLRDAQGNALTDRAVDWFSSDLLIANGAVAGNVAALQGLKPGVVTISVTSEGITGFSTVAVVASGGSQPIPLTCGGVAGGKIFAQDGEYLGRLTNQFDGQSILNGFGSYGNQFSPTSIYNSFSKYGNQFSALSAYNTLASTPPQLFVGTQFAAYVTKNTLKSPRVDPDALRGCAFP